MWEIDLKQPKGLHWFRLYRLYRSAFPREERKPFSIIVKMYRQGKSDIWCVMLDGKFVGLSATINGGDIILLDYFAVKKEYRGRGIGSVTFKKLLEIYRGHGLFVEIESTQSHSPGKLQRQKRKKFYLAAGLEEFHTCAEVFGVEMELLGKGCHLDFDGYQTFYREQYSPWAAEHIRPISE